MKNQKLHSTIRGMTNHFLTNVLEMETVTGRLPFPGLVTVSRPVSILG